MVSKKQEIEIQRKFVLFLEQIKEKNGTKYSQISKQLGLSQEAFSRIKRLGHPYQRLINAVNLFEEYGKISETDGLTFHSVVVGQKARVDKQLESWQKYIINMFDETEIEQRTKVIDMFNESPPKKRNSLLKLLLNFENYSSDDIDIFIKFLERQKQCN